MAPKWMIVAAAVAAFSSQAWAQGTWTSKAESPVPIMLQGGGAHTGKVVMFGGYDPNTGQIYSAAWMFDPAANTWTPRAPLPAPVCGMATVAVGGKIYSIGGTTDGYTPIGDVYVYDPATDTWATKTSMPTARALLMAAEAGGKIYACGGFDSWNYFATVEEYDPVTDTWTTAASLPIPLSQSFIGGINGKVYIAGGWSDIPGAQVLPGSMSNISRATFEYDPATNVWTQKANMPDSCLYGVYWGQSAVIGDRLHCFGGDLVMPSTEAFTQNLEYQPSADLWTSHLTPPTWQTGAWACAAGGKAYVIGNQYTGGATAYCENSEWTPAVTGVAVSNLAQFDATGAPVAIGGTVTGTIRLEGVLDGGTSMRIEIEVQPVGTPFTGVPTISSAYGSASVTWTIPGAGQYVWRARAADASGVIGAWTDFGGSDPDFVVPAPPVPPTPPPAPAEKGKSKKGGCGGSAGGSAHAMVLMVAMVVAATALLRR